MHWGSKSLYGEEGRVMNGLIIIDWDYDIGRMAGSMIWQDGWEYDIGRME